MTTTVSSKGQIVLPAEIRQQDGVKPGQQFEVERVDLAMLEPDYCHCAVFIDCDALGHEPIVAVRRGAVS